MNRETEEITTATDGQKQLLIAIFNNNLEEIEILLSIKSVLINYEFNAPYNKTALEIACCEFISVIQRATIKLLIQSGAEARKALYYAAREANLEIVQELLENQVSLEGNTILISLVKYMKINSKIEHNYLEVINLLLRKVDINIKNPQNECTAIYLAAKYGYYKIVSAALELCWDKVDLDNYKDEKFCTARDFIEMQGDFSGALPDPVRKFEKISLTALLTYIRQRREGDFFRNYKEYIRHGESRKDEDENILLLAAAERGLINIVRFFLHAGVDSNKIFKYLSDLFPLKYASVRGFFEVVEVLLDYANSETVNISLIELVRTKFDEAEMMKVDHSRCLDLLLGHKYFDIEFKDESGTTALYYASMHQSSEVIQKILRKGGSLTSKNKNGKMVIELLDAETLKHHLDECMTFSKYMNVPGRQLVEMNFSSLLPNALKKTGGEDAENLLQKRELSFLETEVLKYMSTKNELTPLLQHPVIDVFLHLKWQSVKKFILINLVIYTIYMIFLVQFIYSKCMATNFMLNAIYYIVVETFLTIFTVVLILREVIQLCIFKFQYFKMYENWIEICLLVSTTALLVAECSSDITINQLYAVVIVCSAIELMLLSGRQFRILFISSMMLQTVSKTLFKWLLSYAILIVAFSSCFFFIFNGDNNKYFENIYSSLFKTIIMVTGEFELENLTFNSRYYIGPIIFIVFVFLVNIVLLGVCTALAISDIQMIINDAETKIQIVRIDNIVYWENALSVSKLFKCTKFLPTICKMPLIQNDPVIKIYVVSDVNTNVYRVTNLYKKKLELDAKTVKNIIAKTETTDKYNIKEYPNVDENFFYNLRKTFHSTATTYNYGVESTKDNVII